MKHLLVHLTVLSILLLAIGFAFCRDLVTAQTPSTPVFLPQVYNGPTPAPRGPYRLSPTIGRSYGGTAYEDSISDTARVTELWIGSGTFIEGLQMWSLNSDGMLFTSGAHGGWASGLHRIVLATDEYIVALNGKGGLYMDSLSVVTNKRTYGPYGGSGGDTAFSMAAPTGYEIVGFFGRAGDLMDYTGAVARQRTSTPAPPAVPTGSVRPVIQLTPTVGWGYGGLPYQDTVPEDGRVAELWVRAGATMDSLQMWFLRSDGTLYSPGKRGFSKGGDLYRLVFDTDEYITELDGIEGEFMVGLTVVTNKRTYGPWAGGLGGSDFSIVAPPGYEICGFYGQYGLGLDLTGALARQRR